MHNIHNTMSHLPSFFKIGDHKRFNFIPRYYDEQKEDLEQRIRQIESDMGIEHGEAYVPKIRKGQMGSYMRKKRKVQSKRANIRLVVIILLLLLAAWFLFYR